MPSTEYTHLLTILLSLRELKTMPSVSENRILLVAEVLVHFGFEHLLDSSGKEALQIFLDVACGFTLGHKHPGELHFFFVESVVSWFYGFSP